MPQNQEQKYSGMTTNERLFVAGLLDKFDAAARKRDRSRMIAILTKVELEGQADEIADTILSDPAKYGF